MARATFGPFELQACGSLHARGVFVPLTPKEESVLRILVEERGRRLSKDDLIDAAWDGAPVSDGSLTRCIHTLRRKLRQFGDGEDFILTSYGRGYQLAVEVRLEEAADPSFDDIARAGVRSVSLTSPARGLARGTLPGPAPLRAAAAYTQK